MGKKRGAICISKSIANFEEKLLKKYSEYKVWRWNLLTPTIFFGLYTPMDYLRFIFHLGKKTVFWSGSDIHTLNTSWFKNLIVNAKADHYCENAIEFNALMREGILAQIHPMFFGDPEDFPISFVPSLGRVRVFLCAHEGREFEYGVDVVERIAPRLKGYTFHIFGVKGTTHDNVQYMGHVDEVSFNAVIMLCHAGLRLNAFDGFSEVTAKSILMGQYPITTISYPHIDQVVDEKTLIDKLLMLELKKEPNYQAREYWHKTLCNRIEA